MPVNWTKMAIFSIIKNLFESFFERELIFNIFSRCKKTVKKYFVNKMERLFFHGAYPCRKYFFKKR